jgi:hypothetical protein
MSPWEVGRLLERCGLDAILTVGRQRSSDGGDCMAAFLRPTALVCQPVIGDSPRHGKLLTNPKAIQSEQESHA